MEKDNTPTSDQSLPIDAAALRSLYARISAASENIDVNTEPERASKFTALMISLTKTIRETETYNRQLAKTGVSSNGGTLEDRLRGYAPSQSELKEMRAELKERLKILGPRLFEDDA